MDEKNVTVTIPMSDYRKLLSKAESFNLNFKPLTDFIELQKNLLRGASPGDPYYKVLMFIERVESEILSIIDELKEEKSNV